MKVVELKEELGERGEALSGNKAWLRRRLHAAIVSEYLESAVGADGETESEERVKCPKRQNFRARRAAFTILPRSGPLSTFGAPCFQVLSF